MTPIEELQDCIIKKIDMSNEIEDEELENIIQEVIEEKSHTEYWPLQKKAILGKDLFNTFRRLDILQQLIEDDMISEIMINGTQNIFVERKGKISQLDKRFVTKAKLEDVIQQIVAESNRLVNEASPIVDARLPDGSRVNVVLYPIALNGPIVTIRKFPKETITMEQLLGWGSINQSVIEQLNKWVKAKYNIFISGSTGSGKTTFLNALSNFIPKDERIITIEDNAELQIKGIPNLVRLESRNANVEGIGELTIRDLIKSALRMRPDRIIVGEVRGEESLDLLQALNTGHQGSFSTGYANSPKDMLSRLETMVLMGMNLPLAAVQRQIASGIDLIIHLGRMRDKSRKVIEIVELLGYENEQIIYQTLYKYQEYGMENGRIKGELVLINELTRKDKLLAAGY